MGDQLVATVNVSGPGTPTINYIHPDHLGGTQIVTDSAGSLKVQDLEYYPFGQILTNTKIGMFDEKHKYTGHEYDADTDLNFMQARYQKGSEGRFWQQDNAFIDIGDSRFKDKHGKSLQEHLLNPQSLNSYVYANNNSLRYIDSDGNLTKEALHKNIPGSLGSIIRWTFLSVAGNLTGKPLSAALLRNSAGLEPGKLLSISESNQWAYGNPINKIKDTEQYKQIIAESIDSAKQGISNNGYDVEFAHRDLYYSLHGADVNININDNGDSWNVNVELTDKYDFNPTNPTTLKGTITRLPATQAYKDQGYGYLSNYDIKINFKDTVKK